MMQFLRKDIKYIPAATTSQVTIGVLHFKASSLLESGIIREMANIIRSIIQSLIFVDLISALYIDHISDSDK